MTNKLTLWLFREAFACSKEEDMTPCCFCSCVSDVKPRPLDPHDVYQQFEIVPYKISCRGDGAFKAKCLVEDGYPPHFLRRKGWKIYTKTPKNYELREANGINDSFRSTLPEFRFLTSNKTSNSVVVGKWYCPFMFIKEGKMAEQMKTSIFYEMTLEQKWEQVFEQENEHDNKGGNVFVNASIHNEAAFIGENRREAIWDERNVVDGVVWFMCHEGDNVKEESVGLRREIVERMRWEEEKVGWIGDNDNRIERVNREEKFEGSGGWRRFACYVLVERFLLKRMDGTLVLSYDFSHTHQLKTIFE